MSEDEQVNGEYYEGCRCTNGTVHPDCNQHRVPTMAEIRARQEAARFLADRDKQQRRG